MPLGITQSAPLNVGIAAATVGATNMALTTATAPINGAVPAVIATALFLNLVHQVIKKIKWFPEHEGTIIVGLLISFLVGYFLLYHGDTANSFINAACSTVQSLINYKGDKASGLNILPPTPPELEFGK